MTEVDYDGWTNTVAGEQRDCFKRDGVHLAQRLT